MRKVSSDNMWIESRQWVYYIYLISSQSQSYYPFVMLNQTFFFNEFGNDSMAKPCLPIKPRSFIEIFNLTIHSPTCSIEKGLSNLAKLDGNKDSKLLGEHVHRLRPPCLVGYSSTTTLQSRIGSVILDSKMATM